MRRSLVRGLSTLAPAQRGRPSASRAAPPPFTRRLKQRESPAERPRSRLRVTDPRVRALLASRTHSRDFAAICEELGAESEVELLASTDLAVWNVALQNRIKQGDARGARALVDLLLGFEPENASEQLWSDLLFTLMRQRSHLSSERDVLKILTKLQRTCGSDFAATVVVSLVNGCANIKMFQEARYLVRFHQRLESTTVSMPPQVLGNLMANMQTKRRFVDVVSFADELLMQRTAGIPVDQVQPQMWISAVHSCAQTGTDLGKYVDRIIEWFEALKLRSSQDHPKFERVLGAVVQSCIATGNERLALRLYHAMTADGQASDFDSRRSEQRLVCPDENIYVNILKACRALHDEALFRDVYRQMVGDNVARNAGFGSAIRFCHSAHDVTFLEEVLDDAFAVEGASNGRWFLPLEQYNDALGCFAETKSFDHAKDLFARMLENPLVTPDHITMVEMVENYREAPFSDIFDLMEVFLELQLTPNMQVFTSLLATCGRHRLINDAMALVDAMKQQDVNLDVKAFTALGFVYATKGHLSGIVETLKDMESSSIETDEKYFDIIMDGLYGAHGIDICFSLFRETLAAGLRIPQGMYTALIRIGTRTGLVERTLHIAYNMECDGYPITSVQMLALMERCEASAEVEELVRTFLLLHQGRSGIEEAKPEARFSQEVYEELIAMLATFSQRDAVAKVKQLAESVGYQIT